MTGAVALPVTSVLLGTFRLVMVGCSANPLNSPPQNRPFPSHFLKGMIILIISSCDFSDHELLNKNKRIH